MDISTAIKGIDIGNITLIQNKGQVCYWLCGKAGKINWCLVEKLDQPFQPPHAPRYTDQEAQEYAIARLDKQLISGTANIKFRDIWDRRQSYALLTLEEGRLDHWSWGRIACIGDSVHTIMTKG